MKKAILITLKDDIVISANATSTGSQPTLDYLPGSVFLGIVASRLYKDLSNLAQAWDVFHSGHVTFHNAYIVSPEGEPTWPSPLSWHHYKNNHISGKQILRPEDIVRYGSNTNNAKPGHQLKQLRDRYVTASGKSVEVKKTASMKTAIDQATGQAADAQLFGYQALQEGQHFFGCIEFSDQVSPDLQEKLLNALQGSARIGRSRGAQYGRVNIQKIDDTAEFSSPDAEDIHENTSEVTFWCLSDLALTDKNTGLPTLLPAPYHFGLSSGQLELKESFLRSRSYDTFNGHRKTFDSRREVITLGSVITFTGLAGITKDQLEHCKKSIGSHTETGLGRLVLQAMFCSKQPLQFHQSEKWNIPRKYIITSNRADKAPESLLIKWLRQQTPDVHKNADVHAWTQATLEKIKTFYRKARAFNAVDPDESVGPSKSQWGSVIDAAKNYDTDAKGLFKELFESNSPVCKEPGGTTNTWGLTDGSEDLSQSLRSWLTSCLNDSGELISADPQQDQQEDVQLDVQFCLRVGSLAKEMRNNNELDAHQSITEA